MPDKSKPIYGFQKMNAIILAGTHADKSKLIYRENKAFLKINNRPLVLNVLDSLQKSLYIDKIAIVGPEKKLEAITKNTNVYIIPESTALKESYRFLENSLKTYNIICPKKDRALFITSDLPFMNSETIDNFILECEKFNAGLYFALINSEDILDELKPFKKSMRFHLKGQGYFRTANMVLYHASRIKNTEFIERQIEKAFPKRRTSSIWSKLNLYWFLARSFHNEVLKYLIGNLREEDVESAFERRTGGSFKFIKTKDIRAGIDIDSKEELEYVKENYNYLSRILDGR